MAQFKRNKDGTFNGSVGDGRDRIPTVSDAPRTAPSPQDSDDEIERAQALYAAYLAARPGGTGDPDLDGAAALLEARTADEEIAAAQALLEARQADEEIAAAQALLGAHRSSR